MNNFTLTNQIKLKSSETLLKEYTHMTGAKLIYFDNSSQEKAFAVAFRTIPSDSTGVFHIIEHSVLSGSENYPISSPILYMLKNSMQTFLNALTFQGKTMYPCASCNEKDFNNLMKVYLDAAFKSLLTYDTFMREGWHLERQGESVAVSGVVFNEMNGAMSSPERILYEKAMNVLYPDTYQAFNSGGDPAHITDLTFEQYRDTYAEYYSVNNCVLLLSGNQDLENTFSIIDGYLLSASRGRKKHEYTVQSALTADEKFTYPVATEEDLKNGYVAFAYNIGEFSDEEKYHAVNVLYGILLSDNSSPVKSALLKSGLVGDVETYMTDEYQRALDIFCMKTESANKEKLREIIENAVKETVRKGIDKKTLKAAVAEYSFRLKERLSLVPDKAVDSFFTMADNVFFELPLNAFFECDVVEKLESLISTDYFERLAEEIFILNGHKCSVVLEPELKDPAAEREALYKKTLERLSPEKTERLIRDFEDYAPRIGIPDSPEAMAKMPSLKREDLSDEIKYAEPEFSDGVFFSEAETNGIVYMRNYFSLDGLDSSELMAAAFLSRAMYDLPCDKKTAAELSDEKKTVFGKISFGVKGVMKREELKAYFEISSAYFESNAVKATDLLKEILTETKFDESGIKEILGQELASIKMSFSQNGLSCAISTALSMISPIGVFKDYTGGYGYYSFLLSYSNDIAELIKLLRSTAVKIFVKDRLTYGFTGGRGCDSYRLDLPEGRKEEPKPLTLRKKRVAYGVSSTVNYNVCAMRTDEIMPYSGKYLVMGKLLSLGYLWHNVRERGNAYGVGIVPSKEGTIAAYSYRDPSVKETYEIYKGIAEFLKNADISDGEILGCIMSVFGSLTAPLTKEEESERNEWNALSGYSGEDVKRTLREAASFSKEDIPDFVKLFVKFAESEFICTVGSASAEKESGLFDEIITV